MADDELTDWHPAWLPPHAWETLGSHRIRVLGEGPLVDTVRAELAQACARFGGQLLAATDDGRADVRMALTAATPADSGPLGTDADDPGATSGTAGDVPGVAALGAEGYRLARRGGTTLLLADAPAGLLYGLFHLVRLGPLAVTDDLPAAVHRPAIARRMLDHWDNVDVHPVMGQVERGYAGGSLFWRAGQLRELRRVHDYARLLASIGINAVAVNNVNVHAAEARLLTDRLGEVAAIAAVLRPYGIRTHLSVTFAAPMVHGGLPTADPLDTAVRDWWASAAAAVYATIPDFGGFLVKADSEGQPGPFTYRRSHADGANALADALAPYGGVVHWRAFVYNHHQDWRDRSTDRARAAHDHFAPLDGQFRDNVVLQVKYGPVDFQVREPVSPLLAAAPGTGLAVELQLTQEYTGQQWHACHLAPLWTEVLGFRPWGDHGRTVADLVTGGIVGVANVGDDPFWTGHPLAQANLYAFGRLAWQPDVDSGAVLDEWTAQTFGPAADAVRDTVHAVLDDSWRTYERYTAPLGVGFMVRPGRHYGPDVDGYEYTQWGTYHFADRDGVGVDRTRATGTGFTGQYPQPWADVYESVDTCPDELLLFFHHVPYGHRLHSGVTVIQHIYDSHFAGVAQVEQARRAWLALPDGVLDPALDARVQERLDEQLRSANEWCDQINAYFFRKSGVPDAHGRRIY
jgi:alpha-glucuronidase